MATNSFTATNDSFFFRMPQAHNLSAFIRLAKHRNIAAHTTVGVCLCIAGHAEYLIAGQPTLLHRGTLFVQSPVIPTEKLAQSDDFEMVEILTDLQSVFALFQRIMPSVLQLDIVHHPCLRLSEEHTQLYAERAQLLQARREDLSHSTLPHERNLLNNWIDTFVQHCLTDMILLFAQTRSQRQEPVSTAQSDGVFSTFMTLLNLHFRNERGVGFYAERLGYSTGHFSALIKQQTGRPPSEWIATITMIEARNLLEHSQLNIKQIAAELGFPEQFTFRKYFKLHEGTSPREYRKQHASTSS